jgi:hypothetical protein
VLYTGRNIVRVLSQDWFTALRQVFVSPGYALGITYFGLNIPGLTSFYQFACHTLFGLPVRDAYRASTSARGAVALLLPRCAELRELPGDLPRRAGEPGPGFEALPRPGWCGARLAG